MLRAAPIRFTPTVGVAPGTTTMQLSGLQMRVVDPYQRDFYAMRGLGAIDTRAHIRWDIIGAVGGGALVLAMLTGTIANAIGHITRRRR